jgi:hypothetical protein
VASAAKSALNGRHLRPIHRHPTPKHAAPAHSNSPQASRIHQSLDKSRFIFRLSAAENARELSLRQCVSDISAASLHAAQSGESLSAPYHLSSLTVLQDRCRVYRSCEAIQIHPGALS